nr:DUF481 domain-containing protein [uncultured Holophaga sp.]
MSSSRIAALLALSLTLHAEGPSTPAPPELPKRPWSDVATLSLVSTTGNSEGRTLGFSNDFIYTWGRSALIIKSGILKVSSATVTRSASGNTLDDATVTETRVWSTTAESCFLNLRKEEKILKGDRWYWFSSLGWERNRPSGLDARYTGSLGMGRLLLDGEPTRLRMDLGLGYAEERPTVPDSTTRDGYWTTALNMEFKRKLGASAMYSADLMALEDLSDTQDWQTNLKQALTASLNKTLALKVAYEYRYRRVPKLVAITAYSIDDSSVSLGSVYIPARKLDTLLTTSLVATF